LTRCWLLAFLALPLAAQQPESLTLDQAVARALENNPRIDAARLSALAAGETPNQLRAAYLPQVTGNASSVLAPDETRVGAGQLQNPLILSRLGFGASVTQYIADFGRTAHLIDSARFRVLAEQEVTRNARALTVLQVTQAYLGVLRAQAIERVANETIAARRTIFEQVQALAESKLKSDLDLRFAEVSLTEARLLLTAAQNDRQAAMAELSAAMGLSSPQQFAVSEIPLRDGRTVTDVELIREAVERNPEAAQRRHILEAALENAEAERRLRYPQISAVATAGLIPAHTDRLVRDTYVAAGVNFTIPIFNGKLIDSRQAEARYRADAAKRTLREAENQVAKNITVALLGIRTATERVSLAADLADRSRQALELAQLRYELGLSTVVELNQAQLALVNAELQQASAQFDLRLQQALLDYHAGSTP
jgi:outer membrane protein